MRLLLAVTTAAITVRSEPGRAAPVAPCDLAAWGGGAWSPSALPALVNGSCNYLRDAQASPYLWREVPSAAPAACSPCLAPDPTLEEPCGAYRVTTILDEWRCERIAPKVVVNVAAASGWRGNAFACCVHPRLAPGEEFGAPFAHPFPRIVGGLVGLLRKSKPRMLQSWVYAGFVRNAAAQVSGHIVLDSAQHRAAPRPEERQREAW